MIALPCVDLSLDHGCTLNAFIYIKQKVCIGCGNFGGNVIPRMLCGGSWTCPVEMKRDVALRYLLVYRQHSFEQLSRGTIPLSFGR